VGGPGQDIKTKRAKVLTKPAECQKEGLKAEVGTGGNTRGVSRERNYGKVSGKRINGEKVAPVK